MSSLPKKIFNRCKKIPVNQLISDNIDGYYFGGVRDKRKGKECIFYIIPNRNNLQYPYIKGFEKVEIEKLWEELLIFGFLKTIDFKTIAAELYKEGGCCVAAFFGIINYLHPSKFIKTRGKISINITKPIKNQ